MQSTGSPFVHRRWRAVRDGSAAAAGARSTTACLIEVPSSGCRSCAVAAPRAPCLDRVGCQVVALR